ncbi:MAG: hypothetical protein H0V17_12140 [Deltaproteobacteria bacterium]|nr:hypothetical protein [Deltaproteobacteria bacterium]
MRLAGLLLLVGVGSAAAEVELKNDSFVDGQPVVFQGGFGIGDIAASRFVAPEAGRTLTKVQLLFGAATTMKTMTLRVYDDTGGSDTPGSVIFVSDVELIGSDTAIQELQPDMPVELPAQFRIGLEFQHAGVPTIANDNDMTNAADRNYLFAANLGGWIKSSTAGVSGDWIIRAFIDGDGGPIGQVCTGNGECPTGEFCDTEIGACTFECRTADDCNGNVCNSLGQCLVDADGGGCCQANRDGEPAALFGALGLLWFLQRRRRCAR